MKKHKVNKKRWMKVILVIVLVIAIGFGVYSIYGSYKINELSKMTYEQMINYTTEGNKDAVITVGVIQNGKIEYNVYGEDGTRLPFKEHIYEIGSITKTFTTSLFCKAINEEKISLEDSINEYLNLPLEEYYPTIKRLVTHTSGYKGFYFEKPMISNFLHRKNEFNGITHSMLIEKMGKIDLEDREYAFTYSNFGFAALGAVLEEIYGDDYTTLINNFIVEDLKLANTRITDGSGDLENYWEWSESDAYMPAGALLSNIKDMIKYVQIHMTENLEYLSIAHRALIEVNASDGNYEKLGIQIDAVGMGWMIDDKNNIIWHNGGTGNYNSYIGFDKEKQIGVVVLSNLPPGYRIPATVIGVDILTSLQTN